MLFHDLAEFLDKLENTSSRLEMTHILVELFTKTSPEEIDKVVYLLQGSVVPQYEKLEFGLAERLVFKAFVRGFSLSEREVRQKYHQLGDLGRTVEEFRRTNHSLFESRVNLDLLQVYEKLKVLAIQSGTGSQEFKLSVLSELLEKLDPLSARYLVRMVVGNLRLGFSDMTVLDALSWYAVNDKSLRGEIEKAFNVRPDLGFIAKLVKQNKLAELRKINPEPGVPILMARAERVITTKDIIAKIGRASIEPKYDGFRLQVHKLKTGEVKIYSRNLDNVVAMFPDLVAAVKDEISSKSCIIEGEAVGYNPQTNKILPFQEIVQRKRKYDVVQKAKEIPLKLFAFDLLYNQRSFLTDSYEVRRLELKKILKPARKTILLAQEQIVETGAEIEAIFEKAVGEGLEGIMAKKLKGQYEAGARGWNWIKLKHSYSTKLMDTLDCLVMGYDYGLGKRSNFGIGAFLVGVLDPKTENYLTVAKIGTGLTDVEWRELKERAAKLKIAKMPASYRVNKILNCDVWTSPSIVVEIRADEISRSPAHTARLALRFPRLERFRSDKSPTDITTLKELTTLHEKQHKSSLSS